METQQSSSSPSGNISEIAPQTVSVEQKNSASSSLKKGVLLAVVGIGIVVTCAYVVIVNTSLYKNKDIVKRDYISSTTDSIVVPATSTVSMVDEKLYEANSGEYSFTYPAVVEYISPSASMRDIGMEATLKKTPVYHLEPFGLQQTFSDSGVIFGVGTTTLDGTHNVFNILKADLAVHKIASSTVYVTSSLFGYDPADWGKIKQTVSIQDYANEIGTKTDIPNRTVVMETISNTLVRHSMPFDLPRPYENETREQYQWVKDGYIFSLIFSTSLTATSTAEVSEFLKHQLLNSVISTLKVKK
jgi:hypothetical protein